MDETQPSYPLVLCRPRRGRFYLYAALALLPALGGVPIFNMAQASRQVAGPTGVDLHRQQQYRAPIPGSVTLGEMIEIQRLARQRRVALAAASTRAAAPPAASAAAAVPIGEGWQAQLGAFSTADGAELQRARLAEAGEAEMLPIVVRHAGPLHRLQSMPAPSRAKAEALCERVQAQGLDCFVRRAGAST